MYTPNRQQEQRREGTEQERASQNKKRNSPSEDGRPDVSDTPAEGRVVAGGVLGGGELADACPSEVRRVGDGEVARADGGGARGRGGRGGGAAVVDVGLARALVEAHAGGGRRGVGLLRLRTGGLVAHGGVVGKARGGEEAGLGEDGGGGAAGLGVGGRGF